jgi:hypothetical protein
MHPEVESLAELNPFVNSQDRELEISPPPLEAGGR